MKKIFSCLVFLFLFATSMFSQKAITLIEIDSALTNDANYLECFYDVEVESLFIGTVYGITYYNKDQHTVTLYLPDNSEMPEYVVYKFPISSDAKIIDNEEGILVKDNDLTYEVSYDRDYFYITLAFKLERKHFVYTGKVEMFDDPD